MSSSHILHSPATCTYFSLKLNILNLSEFALLHLLCIWSNPLWNNCSENHLALHLPICSSTRQLNSGKKPLTVLEHNDLACGLGDISPLCLWSKATHVVYSPFGYGLECFSQNSDFLHLTLQGWGFIYSTVAQQNASDSSLMLHKKNGIRSSTFISRCIIYINCPQWSHSPCYSINITLHPSKLVLASYTYSISESLWIPSMCVCTHVSSDNIKFSLGCN